MGSDGPPEINAGVVGRDDDLGLLAHGSAPMLLSEYPAPRRRPGKANFP
jgi:hypothetical protein